MPGDDEKKIIRYKVDIKHQDGSPLEPSEYARAYRIVAAKLFALSREKEQTPLVHGKLRLVKPEK